ncbi:MAG: nicotinate-nucleotide adenylyltransferase [Thermodesulfobacteriota bacterium]
MINIGVIHGRFQILHHDHLKYLLAGKERCQHLIVGISNPDPNQTKSESVDPKRSSAAANPLTYYERLLLVRASLEESGIPLADFSIVPFPINFPELLLNYVPPDATFFLTIYDDWGKKKLARFQELGLKTEILWQRALGQKGQTATEIRRRILHDEAWQDLVPASVATLLKKINIEERLHKMAG